jgi:hypothetical protein
MVNEVKAGRSQPIWGPNPVLELSEVIAGQNLWGVVKRLPCGGHACVCTEFIGVGGSGDGREVGR